MLRVLVVTMLAGCSFRAATTSPVIDADSGSDADATGSELPAPVSCWPRWHDHSIAFSAPALVDSLRGPSNSTTRDISLGAGDLTIYFTSNRGTTSDLDIYSATRASTSDDFDHIDTVRGLDSPMPEFHFTVASDGLHGVLAAMKPPNSDVDLYAATRGSPTDKFDLDDQPMALLNDGHDQHDPFLTDDGLTLYYAPFVDSQTKQLIMMSTRTSIDGDFSVPAPVINSTMGDADPYLSPDQTVMVFSSTRSGGRGKIDAWYVVRDSISSAWSDATPLGDLDTADNESDTVVSRDGCTVYFASDRTTLITSSIYAAVARD